MPGMVELVVDLVFKQSAKLQRAHRYVHSGIYGQNDIREPIHQVQQRVPVEIWVVPSELAGELLEHAQEAGNHEAHQPSVGPCRIKIVIATCKLDHGNRDEQCTEGGHDHVACAVSQIEYPVIERIMFCL